MRSRTGERWLGNLRCVCVHGAPSGPPLVPDGNSRRNLRRQRRPRRHGRRRHALRQHAKQSDRGHRVASAASRQPLRAARSGSGEGQMARRHRLRSPIRFLSDGAFSVEGEGHKYRPWGFAGGDDGSTASLSLRPASAVEAALPSKVPIGERATATGWWRSGRSAAAAETHWKETLRPC
jgi:hypothetical protein